MVVIGACAAIEREDDAASTGVERDLDQVLGGSRSWRGGLCGGGRCKQEAERKGESDKHGHAK